MKVKSFTFNSFEENTYILYDESKECIIIDPGCYSENEKNKLTNFISSNELNPIKLINTHCHIDHIFGNKFVCNKWDIPLYIHKSDLALLEQSVKIAEIYGFENYEQSPKPQYFLDQNDSVKFGNSNLNILFAPGHAPGHICLYSKENDLLISGDVIFKGSIGRTDLPGGDHKTLIESIKKMLSFLPEKTQVFCGHGPPTTIGFEKENNPFLL